MFKNAEEYKRWIDSQNWYQSIVLPNSGLKINGKFNTHERLSYFEKNIDFTGKRVLDVGCNSGQNSLFAKAAGAREVIGIDVDENRLKQARILAENEKIDILFLNKSIYDIADLGQFDIVLCVAVLTEIPEFFRAINALKNVVGSYCYLETELNRSPWLPLNPKFWFKKAGFISQQKAFIELRELKSGQFAARPTFETLKVLFGEDYKIERKGKSVRYDIFDMRKIQNG